MNEQSEAGGWLEAGLAWRLSFSSPPVALCSSSSWPYLLPVPMPLLDGG